jgi:hypothetical protein
MIGLDVIKFCLLSSLMSLVKLENVTQLQSVGGVYNFACGPGPTLFQLFA